MDVIPNEVIINKIFLVRGKKVMLDSDLAAMYGVEPKVLNQAVKRNIKRFPDNYTFQLTAKEHEVLRSQIVTLNSKRGTKYTPHVFTEHGILMLSSVLRSDIAINVSMKIIDVFIALREALADNSELRKDIQDIKKVVFNQGKNQELILSYLDELMDKADNPQPRTKIGFNN